MFNVYEFNHPQKTWERPLHASPNNVNSKTIINALAADFQENLKRTVLLEKYSQHMADRLPLVDNVGVYISLYSRKKCDLHNVGKNVLDALGGSNLAYSDDSKVFSVYAEQAVAKNDVIKIALYPETRFFPNSIVNNAFFKFDVDAIPTDEIIQNPRTTNHRLKQNPSNTAYIGMIAQEIKMKGATLLTSSDLAVYIDIYTAKYVGDIDNYCLPYLLAMEGIVYKNMKQISNMHLNLYRNCSGRDYAKVQVYDCDMV